MKNLTTINHLKQQFSIPNFVEKTIRQFNKDGLGLMDSEVSMSAIEATDVLGELIIEVKAILRYLDEVSHLQQFVYKVDLPEKAWQYFLSFQNFESLAEEIIIREAQKVYLREMFK